MKKQDLKDGMILETRNGERYLLVDGLIRNFDGFIVLEWFNDDLTYNNNQYDIVKVYENIELHSLTNIFDDKNLTLIWERKETNLTDKEVEVLQALKMIGHKWLGRDSNGRLYSYAYKPNKGKSVWTILGTALEIELFNFIKWADDEPTNIDDLLKGV